MNSMVMYRILNKGSEVLVSITAENENYVAKITGNSSFSEVLITGISEEDVYFNCRSWASTHIRGEFAFERVTSVISAA